MTRTTLAIVVAFPLFLVVLALAAFIQLAGPVTAERQGLAKSIQLKSSAAELLATGQIAPSIEKVSAALRAAAESDKAEQKMLGDLWAVMVAAFWAVVTVCAVQIVVCIIIFRKRQPHHESPDHVLKRDG